MGASIERDDSPIKSYHFGHSGKKLREASTEIPVFISRTRNSGIRVDRLPPRLFAKQRVERRVVQDRLWRTTHRDSNRYSLCLSLWLWLFRVLLREFFSFETFLGAIRMRFNRILCCGSNRKRRIGGEIFLLWILLIFSISSNKTWRYSQVCKIV